MRKKIFIIFVMVVTVSFAQLFAQTATVEKRTKIGLGIAIADIKDLFNIISGQTMTPQIFLPIRLSSGFMMEPGFGCFKLTEEEGSYTNSTSMYTFGIGLFPTKKIGCLDFYYGIRMGMVAGSSKEEYQSQTVEEKMSGFFIAPTIGGEYFFCKNFSIGGEAQFSFTSFKSEKEGDDEKYKVLATRTLLFIRCYF